MLVIIILLFIFVLAWIISSIYHSGSKSTISETTNRDIAPIEPVFDTKTLDELKKRQKINPIYELESITPTPIAFPTSTVPTQAASKGGQLLL